MSVNCSLRAIDARRWFLIHDTIDTQWVQRAGIVPGKALNWPSWTARAKRKAVGAVGLIPRGDINTQNQAQVGDQVDMVAIEGRPRLCGL